MKQVHKVKDGDSFVYVEANGSTDREEKILQKKFLPVINVFDAKVGSKIVFHSGTAMIDRSSFDLQNLTGTVVKVDEGFRKEVHVKLDNHFKFLSEWSNCVIFDTDTYDNEDYAIKVVETGFINQKTKEK